LYRIAFIIAAFLAVALGLLVGTLNSDTVSVDLLWVQIQWPLGLLLLCVLVVGLLIGLLITWFFSVMPLKTRLRKAQSKES
jgi:uncharacterized integral membrane protein